MWWQTGRSEQHLLCDLPTVGDLRAAEDMAYFSLKSSRLGCRDWSVILEDLWVDRSVSFVQVLDPDQWLVLDSRGDLTSAIDTWSALEGTSSSFLISPWLTVWMWVQKLPCWCVHPLINTKKMDQKMLRKSLINQKILLYCLCFTAQCCLQFGLHTGVDLFGTNEVLFFGESHPSVFTEDCTGVHGSTAEDACGEQPDPEISSSVFGCSLWHI